MKYILFFLYIFISIFSISQPKNKLSFEFGIGQNSFAMDRLNEYYIDSFSIKNKLLDDKIKKGQNYFLNLKYQPSSFFDIGVYGQYQFGEEQKEIEIEFKDGFGNTIEQHQGSIILRTEAISLGINSNYYISSLLKFNEKNSQLIQHFKIAFEFNAGVAFSKVITQTLYPTYKPASYYDFFSSIDFQSQTSLKFEYEVIESPIITSLGLKFGYQYFRTKIVKDKYGNNWNVLSKYPITLDFSGLFGAIYVNLGK